jgi:hypothetical protein
MVELIGHTAFLFLLLVGAALAVVARNRRGLLWGSALTTIGLVGTLWISGVEAITSLVAIVFLIFDFFIFAFSGSIRLLPKNSPGNAKASFYPALVVWLVLVFLVAALYFIWQQQWPADQANSIDLDQLLGSVLHDFWDQRSFLLFLIVALIFGVSVGSFFMIEREKQS